jgi:hypothetical protein
MTVQLKPIGSLINYTGGQAEISIKAGATVREMIIEIGIPPEIIAMVTVNDCHQNKDYRPQDGDVVKLIAIYAGS